VRFTPTERQEYEDSLKVYRDLKNSIDTAVEEGWIQGHAKGRAEGLEEGQMKMAKQVAQKLLATGMNISSVADIMNLSIKEIESLMTKEE
jgi:predicted transposase/invertase (TIGR01784 family)